MFLTSIRTQRLFLSWGSEVATLYWGEPRRQIWCMLREILICIFICEFICYSINNRKKEDSFLGLAKKLLKKERLTKMKNIYTIVISTMRSNWIWYFTAPHHVTCVTLNSYMICVTLMSWTNTSTLYLHI